MGEPSLDASASVKATIDRFERDAAGRQVAVLVFDDQQQLVVPADALPKGSRRGDVLTLAFVPDPEETQRRAGQGTRLQRELFGP